MCAGLRPALVRFPGCHADRSTLDVAGIEVGAGGAIIHDFLACRLCARRYSVHDDLAIAYGPATDFRGGITGARLPLRMQYSPVGQVGRGPRYR
jgi:hypothetical protein